jgi:hypothetical protein
MNRGMTQLVDHLLCKYKSLSSNPGPPKNTKEDIGMCKYIYTHIWVRKENINIVNNPILGIRTEVRKGKNSFLKYIFEITQNE